MVNYGIFKLNINNVLQKIMIDEAMSSWYTSEGYKLRFFGEQ